MGLKYESASKPLHISVKKLASQWFTIKTARCTVCTAICAGAALVAQDVGREFRKVDVRPPGKEKSNSHGASPVHLITMTEWIQRVGVQ